MKSVTFFIVLFCSLFTLTSCSKENLSPSTPPSTSSPESELVEIQIKQQPEQLIYALHSSEPINLKGLLLEGTYSNGEKRILTVKAEHIFNFSTQKENQQLPVTIRIEGKEAVFHVQIVNDTLNQVEDDGTDTYTVAPHIRHIGPKAFQNTHFTHVILNEGLVSIGKEAFAGTPVAHIQFPSTLQEIETLAFYLCHYLKEADLSHTQLTAIRENVFHSSGIQQIQLPSTLTHIEDQAFLNTHQLQNITLPSSVQSIGMEAFRASGITHAVLPNNLRQSGKRAFMLCNNLTTVTCTHEPVTYTEGYIASGFFEKCPHLQEISYPGSICNIDRSQVSENPTLTLLRLPAHLQTIGFSAFDNCQHIERIELLASTPPSLDIYSLPKANKITQITVPQGSIGTYTSHTDWKKYLSVIKE